MATTAPSSHVPNSAGVRTKAGMMLTFDELSKQRNIAERGIMKRVLQNKEKQYQSCLSLPLTLLYAIFYMMCVFLHEDFTNQFFFESTVRENTRRIFDDVETIDDLWDAVINQFTAMIFQDVNSYGEPRTKNSTHERWGTWGRITSYNQIQGAIRVRQSRKKAGQFGIEFTDETPTSLEQELVDSGEGFESMAALMERRRQEDEAAKLEEYMSTRPDAGARRLRYMKMDLRQKLPAFPTTDLEKQFTFWLYPAEARREATERLEYFQKRQWVDQYTDNVEIQMYIMNAELGRPRLVEMIFRCTFSESGGIFYETQYTAIFLEFWAGFKSVLADFCFLIIITYFTLKETVILWRKFKESKFVEHVVKLSVSWEWFVLLFGWANIYFLYGAQKRTVAIMPKLQAIRSLGTSHTGWTHSTELQELSEELFTSAEPLSASLYFLRMIYGWYSLLLMFRFFISFGVQPRLAIVTSTMKCVILDLLHFMVIAVPTFMAYVISGNIVFGRRIEDFATIQGSFAACFKIAMESEYEWEDMSEQYWTTAFLWITSFIWLIVLILLNMVLAIIVDVYNEVRLKSVANEAIWTSFWIFGVRARNARHWVRDDKLSQRLDEDPDLSVVRADDLRKMYPLIPQSQLDLLFDACQKEMAVETSKDITPENLLALSGTVMISTEDAQEHADKMLYEESKDPVKSWVTPTVLKTPAAGRADFDRNFMSAPASAKGKRIPQISNDTRPVDLDVEDPAMPDYLKEVHELLIMQRKWMDHVQWRIQQCQWTLQTAHLAKLQEARSGEQGEQEDAFEAEDAPPEEERLIRKDIEVL